MLRTVINRPKFILQVEKTEQRDWGDLDARADTFTCDDTYRDDDRDVVRCDDVVGCVPLKLLRYVVSGAGDPRAGTWPSADSRYLEAGRDPLTCWPADSHPR